MTAPLDHYRDQIQEHNKTHHKRTLPPHLAALDFLLACHQNDIAAGLAEKLEQMENEIKVLREPWNAMHEFVKSRDHIHAPGRDVDRIIMEYAEQLERDLAAIKESETE